MLAATAKLNEAATAAKAQAFTNMIAAQKEEDDELRAKFTLETLDEAIAKKQQIYDYGCNIRNGQTKNDDDNWCYKYGIKGTNSNKSERAYLKNNLVDCDKRVDAESLKIIEDKLNRAYDVWTDGDVTSNKNTPLVKHQVATGLYWYRKMQELHQKIPAALQGKNVGELNEIKARINKQNVESIEDLSAARKQQLAKQQTQIKTNYAWEGIKEAVMQEFVSLARVNPNLSQALEAYENEQKLMQALRDLQASLVDKIDERIVSMKKGFGLANPKAKIASLEALKQAINAVEVDKSTPAEVFTTTINHWKRQRLKGALQDNYASVCTNRGWFTSKAKTNATQHIIEELEELASIHARNWTFDPATAYEIL